MNELDAAKVDGLLARYHGSYMRTPVMDVMPVGEPEPPLEFLAKWHESLSWRDFNLTLSQGDTPAGKRGEKVVESFHADSISSRQRANEQKANYRQLGAQYAQLALRTLMLLHGGALVLLPTIAEVFGEVVSQELLLRSSSYFVIGLATAILCAGLAYLNFLCLESSEEINLELHQLNTEMRLYSSVSPVDIAQQTIRSLRAKDKSLWNSWLVQGTLYMSILFALSSFLFLILGAQEMRASFGAVSST